MADTGHEILTLHFPKTVHSLKIFIVATNQGNHHQQLNAGTQMKIYLPTE